MPHPTPLPIRTPGKGGDGTEYPTPRRRTAINSPYPKENMDED